MSTSDVFHHSMVIASDHRIADPVRVGKLLRKRRGVLASMGAHHVLVYRSLRESGRVLVLIGVRSREPVEEVLRSGVFHEWFDAAGVEDIPAVFAGEIVDRYGLAHSDAQLPPGVVVSAIVAVDDVALLIGELHSAKASFAEAGVRNVRVLQAFDDPHEVMIVQDFDTEVHARQWIRQHHYAADWMAKAGVGVYPPLFVGDFLDMVRI